MSVPVNKKCCVSNCGKSRPEVILHNFPNPDNDIERFRTWLYAVGGDILSLDNKVVHKYRRVCHLHFASRYYTRSNRLSANAVPTKHLPGFLISRNPLEDITNRGNVGIQPQLVFEGGASTSTGVETTFHNQSQTSLQNNFAATASSASKQKRSKKSIIPSGEARLFQTQINKLRKTKNEYIKKLKAALKLAQNTSFIKALNNFSTFAAIFTMMQFREVKKKARGRRFTKSEKIAALALYKQGPRCYRWFRGEVVLPAPVTLSRLISTANLKTGINENIFTQLKKRVAKMSATEKICSLLFDEVAIAPHFDYNRRKDRITGFVDNGKQMTKKIADHALVFMIRGVVNNYKQAVHYTFSNGSTSKEELVVLLKEIITKLQTIGFKVVSTICDQGASNVSAINNLIENRNRQAQFCNKNKRIFTINDEEIIPLYDSPHLIKGIRNNLITKNLQCEIDGQLKTAKWEHFSSLYKEDPTFQGLRLLPKLTENHVNPKKIPKMKVKMATQLLSNSVAVTMGYLADKGILPEECKETACVTIFFDQLFDSVNGSYRALTKKPGKVMLGPLTTTSPHKKIWKKAKEVLKSMKFIDAKGKVHNIPTLKHWIQNIENLEYLKTKLNKLNVKSIWLRHLNQDPLENFFSSVRSHGYRSNNPTCAGFEVAFASLLIKSVSSVHSPGANCEKDACSSFTTLKDIFFDNSIKENIQSDIDIDDVNCDDHILGLDMKKNNPKAMAQLEYVAGYVLRKTQKSIFKNCPQCCFNLYTTNKTSSSGFLENREYSSQRCLTYPANDFLKLFSDIQDVITHLLKKLIIIPNIRNYIKTILYIVCDTHSINSCSEHKKYILEYVLDLSCRFFLCKWCKDSNNILKGSRIDFDHDDQIQMSCYSYYLKRKK